MSVDARFEQFRRLVLEDVNLQERLRGVTEWPAFVATALGEAAEHGVELAATDLEAARRTATRSWLDRWV
jgi:hypothetical protein